MKRTYRCALITGATSGIGEAFAYALPEETGLLLTGRNEAKLMALRDQFASSGRTVEILQADLREPEDRQRLSEAGDTFETDLFINNAGLGYFSRFVETPRHDEGAMVQVNVVAVHELAHALLPNMLARAKESGARAGLIVVSSVLGHLPVPYFATYAATKAFDLAFAEGLSEEMSDEPIDILALCPGATTTDFQTRSGAPLGVFDRAESSISVARKGLSALGRRRVLVSQLPLRFGLAYNTIIHRITTSGAKVYFNRLMRSERQG